MNTRAQIRVLFQTVNNSTQTKLAELDYKPGEGRVPTMVVSDAKVELPDGSAVTINSGWSPDNNMVSLLVFRNGKLVGHSGNCWHRGDPYLDVQIEDARFLHLYLKKNRNLQPIAWRVQPISIRARKQLLGVRGLANLGRCVFSYSSERSNTRAIHIQCCPHQPRTDAADHPPASRD